MNARALIRNAVAALARESGPLAAITVAAHLEREAREAARTHARTAREDGETWDRIAGALGAVPDPARALTATAAAFYRLASVLSDGPCFAWTCPRCRATVLDRGPEAGGPEDQERGHAEGCSRLAETVRAWDAQWRDDSDD